jgi:hypothetical protein
MNLKTNLLIPIAVLFLVIPGHSASAGAHPFRIDLLGTPAPQEAAARTILIGPDTRHVNVVRNEVIRFNVGGKLFAWSFDGPLQVNSIDLNRVAPPGLLNRPVIAYISPDPKTDTPSL